jgi:hypothetical protein
MHMHAKNFASILFFSLACVRASQAKCGFAPACMMQLYLFAAWSSGALAFSALLNAEWLRATDHRSPASSRQRSIRRAEHLRRTYFPCVFYSSSYYDYYIYCQVRVHINCSSFFRKHSVVALPFHYSRIEDCAHTKKKRDTGEGIIVDWIQRIWITELLRKPTEMSRSPLRFVRPALERLVPLYSKNPATSLFPNIPYSVDHHLQLMCVPRRLDQCLPPMRYSLWDLWRQIKMKTICN